MQSIGYPACFVTKKVYSPVFYAGLFYNSWLNGSAMESDLLELISAGESLINNAEATNNAGNSIKEVNIFSQENSEVTPTTTNTSKVEDSVVHTGLSDSSDDEDNKYFEEAKYNEYGKTVKKLLQPSNNKNSTTNNISDTWKSKATSGKTKQLSVPSVKSTSSNDIFVDPIFHIRIINPLVSSMVLQERMVGRESVSIAKLKWYVQRLTPDKDWVVAGVIVQKSASRTSHKGNQFCIWSISDLHGDLKTASVFLFGKSYQHLWKTVVGTVVGILNPNVLDRKDGSRDEACLSIDNHQKVMILGQSKDFGTCKSMKKSGEPCTAFINTSQTEHCIYHLKQEYQKYSSNRSAVQSSFTNNGLTALRNKVLGKNEVFYAGKSYTAIPAKKSKKLTAKDEGRIKSLTGKISVNSNVFIKSQNLGNRKKMTASRVELTKNQRAKDLELLRKLGANSELNVNLNEKTEFSGSISREVSLAESKQAALSVINKLKDHAVNDGKSVTNKEEVTEDEINDNLTDINKSNSIQENKCNTPQQPNFVTIQSNNRSFLNQPTLMSPSISNNGKGKIIDLNSPISRRLVNKAKLNALNYVQKNGVIPKSDPMSTKGTAKKRCIDINDSSGENDPKKQKLQENEFFSERFKKMMAATSVHADLLEKHDEEEKEKYFKKLEIKEKMEETMSNTYKVQCKAVRCLKCKYTSFSASDKCKTEKHPLKVFDAFKRFFQCANCGNRTVCLEIVPTVACKNCGSGKWERVGMMKERKIENLHSLSIRGGEQKFVNSAVTNGNLDLLMSTDD